jgi:hypothetical protein
MEGARAQNMGFRKVNAQNKTSVKNYFEKS